MRKHGVYYDSRIKLLLILLTSALAFALGGGLTGLLLFGVVCLFALLSLYSSAYVGASPSNSFIFRDNILFTKNFDYCTCFEYSISDYGNIGIDSSASGKSYPSSNCDTSGYHIEISSIFETRCALYKTRDENEGRGIVFLENSKSSGADIRRLFNPYTYAPSDDGDRIIRISGNARHQLSL